MTHLPIKPIDIMKICLTKYVKLADPSYVVPGKIDLLTELNVFTIF